MSFAGNCIASLLLAGFCSVTVRAEEAAASGNPYLAIAARNAFGLVAMPASNPADDAPPPEPPPKITPNGIMNIFGHLQVLFKVATKPVAGQPPTDASYTMSEGERQDEIEVVKIDGAAGVVTFNNHGIVQELPLVAAASTGAAPAPGGRVNPGFPLPQVRPPLAGFRRFGSPANMPGGNAGAGADASNFAAPNAGTAAGSRIYNPAAETTETLTPEAQVIMMEAQRAQWQEQGNPAAAIIPPTPITHLIKNGETGTAPADPPVP